MNMVYEKPSIKKSTSPSLKSDLANCKLKFTIGRGMRSCRGEFIFVLIKFSQRERFLL